MQTRFPAPLGLLLVVLLPSLSGCGTGVILGGASPASTREARTTGTIVEDQSIEIKISNAILTDPQMRGSVHINASSYNMRVLLTGETPSEALKTRATEIARQVQKVRDVHNAIQIAAPSSVVSRTSDSYLTTKVKAQLLTYKDFDATRVKVVTEDGTCYLMGLLPPSEGELVANIVRQVGGVQKVVTLFEDPGKSSPQK